MSKGQLYRSVFITALLTCAIGISACQSEPEPVVEDSVSNDESVPMSAEPADPNDMVIAANDAALDEGDSADEMLMPVTGTQLTYLCSPELSIEATYKDDEGTVRLATSQGLLTLVKNTNDTATNDNTNSLEVFEAASELDGSTGFTQWRLEDSERESGVLLTGADINNVDTYNCDLLD